MDIKTKQKALQMISNGMYIITSRAGTRYGGATVSWMSQVSFKPSLIMAAIRPESSVFACLSESRHVALHVLAAHQEEIARKFLLATHVADGLMNGEPFSEGKTSAPILNRIATFIECQVRQIIDDGGDHTLVIMEVVNAAYGGESRPLLVADSPWRYGG